MLSQSINAYSAPCAPLAGTFRFRRFRFILNAFAVQERLGDPRVVPCFRQLLFSDMSSSMSPEELVVACIQYLHHVHRPSHKRPKCSASSTTPQIRFMWIVHFGASRFAYAATCRIARLPGGPDRKLLPPPANGGFYFQAFDGLVTRPIVGYNYGSYWTILPVGLSPTRAAASFAARLSRRYLCIAFSG